MTTAAASMVTELVGDQAGRWDREGRLPAELLRRLASGGLLCPQVPAAYGGLGMTGLEAGEFTAHVGSLCGSLRSVLTSQGMAAWVVQRLGTAEQRAAYLPKLASGTLAGVAFSERSAGSDLSAIATRISDDGDDIVVQGEKTWVTGAAYADLLIVFGRDGVALVPARAHGVRVEPVAQPLGCRAGGHATVSLDEVRLPRGNRLGTGRRPIGMQITSALTYGRLSVAWGCVGILRACLAAAVAHARTRSQFGRPLAEHQLVARYLAELLVTEQSATRVCEHASRCWDLGRPEVVTAVVVAKHLSASGAARGAASAVQVLASAGAHDDHVVARAYRDAKVMEIIEGSSEISQLLLAEHAIAEWS
ncbi:acyl-CoA dehydrogenase family protein [Nonomuraea sp. NPDC050451]|uniref:acyl-CoA dehydrogenase family protein n=1 Tax=Nonomuraea sp. NPDC050451 TaxID=3364364 RepID=UPI003791A4C8